MPSISARWSTTSFSVTTRTSIPPPRRCRRRFRSPSLATARARSAPGNISRACRCRCRTMAAYPCRRRGPATGRSRNSSRSRRRTTAFRLRSFREATDQISIQQLYNGVQPEGNGCGTPFPNLFPQAANFIEILNGETALDGQVSNAGSAAGRSARVAASKQGPHSGTLYVTMFDNRRSCRRRQPIHD